MIQHLGDKTGGTAWSRIPTIGNDVDADILEAPSGGPAQQAAQVVDVAVHSAIGAEPNQVKGLAIGEQLVGQGVEGWIGGNAAVLDGLANPHQFLANNPAGSNGEVPHLRVAHLAIG